MATTGSLTMRIVPCLLLALAASLAVARPDSVEPLPEAAYRQPLEEVIVTGRAPEWRRPPQAEWRPRRFELRDVDEAPRMEWFPRYERDERDNMTNVNNRMDEKAGIKLLEWRF